MTGTSSDSNVAADWTCGRCGRLNSSPFCGDCGTARANNDKQDTVTGFLKQLFNIDTSPHAAKRVLFRLLRKPIEVTKALTDDATYNKHVKLLVLCLTIPLGVAVIAKTGANLIAAIFGEPEDVSDFAKVVEQIASYVALLIGLIPQFVAARWLLSPLVPAGRFWRYICLSEGYTAVLWALGLLPLYILSPAWSAQAAAPALFKTVAPVTANLFFVAIQAWAIIYKIKTFRWASSCSLIVATAVIAISWFVNITADWIIRGRPGSLLSAFLPF